MPPANVPQFNPPTVDSIIFFAEYLLHCFGNLNGI